MNLFGYLHEDWADDYDDVSDAIRAFALGEPEYAPLVRADIEATVDRCRTEVDLVRALRQLGLAYAPVADGWSSQRSWLLAVADDIDRLRTPVSPASGA